MKIIKKLLSVILVAAMVFTTFGIGITATAESATTETGTTTDSPLEVVVTTNKADYGKFKIAEITVTVTNTGYGTVENVSAEAVFDDLAPVDSLYSETSKKAETLEPGESFSFSYKAMLNYKSSNVDFFSKIILWFVWLFNDGYTVVNGNSEADIENVTEIKFGKVSADNIIKISYDKIDYNIDEIIELSTNVSTEISEFRKCDEYKNAIVEEKVTLMGDFLHSLQNNGKIKNVKYNASSCVYKYELYNGWKYGIVINNKHNDCWSSPNAINQRELDLNLYSNKSSISQNYASKNRWEFLFDDIPSNDNISYRNMHNLFDFYSDNLIDTSIGFSTGMTVNVYKNLTGNKLIYIMSHGNFDGELPLIITTEKATEQKQRDYSLDYDRGDIEIWDFGDEHSEDLRFIIRPSIFENNYKNNELNGCIIFLSCCGAFGMDNQENYAFSESLKKAGASTIIGFCNSVNEVYSAVFYEKILQLLSSGNTVYEAYNNARNLIGHNQNIFIKNYTNENLIEEFPAYPIFSGERNTKLFDNSFNSFGSCTISIKDNVNNQSIKDVYAFAISDLKTLGFTSIAKSEENGVLTITAPAGKYYCDLTTDNYESKQIEIVIEADVNKVLFDPVYLTRKTYTLSGTVKDETTGNAISGVRVEFIDNSSDSLDPVATATTDTNGLFSVNLPYGSYSLSFNHDNYEYYGTTVNVDTENVVLTEPVQLKPNTQYCSITGTVKNKVTESIISGVTVELVNSESGSKIVTTTTDENGQFTIKFPYGDYSLKFIHNDYMSASTTVSVKSQSEAMIAKLRFRMSAVSLTPKNNSSSVEVATFLGKDISEVINVFGSGYTERNIDLAHYYFYDNGLAFSISENAYAGLEPKNVNSVSAIMTHVTLYKDFSSDMSYNDLIKLVPDIEKPESFYNNPTGEYMYSSSFIYENYLFVYIWTDYSYDDVCYQASVIQYGNSEQSSVIDSGLCGANGDNVTWTFYDDGELVINGNGAMADYQSWADIPWHIYEDQIEIVTIGNRITRIGKMAFADCSNLQKIEIGNSVESIGVKALSSTGLIDVIIPDSVRTIEDSAFFGCSYLTNIVLGKNVTIIGQMAFQRCGQLASITIPKSLSSIGSQAFYKCDSLKNVYYKGTSTNWANIGMGSYNTALTNATIHYNS